MTHSCSGVYRDHDMIDPDALHNLPYSSSRQPLLARNGVVATSQPLAAQAGLEMLQAGGTAVDAAIATAATLTVVEPTNNGLGSDAFALVWDGSELHGLNGSGRWPAANTVSGLTSNGHLQMPLRGWPTVTVPGAIDAWASLHERFGRLSIEQILRPALRYAEEGFAVSPVVARHWAEAAKTFPALSLSETSDWVATFTDDGRAPKVGERWSSPEIARGLDVLSSRGLRDFYEGEIATSIAAYSEATGGSLRLADLKRHRSEWVDPISIRYRGVDVWEIPPNGQGIAALMALGIVDASWPVTASAGTDPSDALSWHRAIEAMKLAFSDSDYHVADQQFSASPISELLDPGYLADRASLITESAGSPQPGGIQRGGTVYLCSADADGMMVSFIQSNYVGFGSGVVVPSHGISLQNRGAGFSLDPTHPNVAEPNKRPRHTIIPGFMTRDGKALGAFGVMGGEMQPQGHLQVVTGMVDHALNPQAVLDAPRWRVDRDWTVHIEDSVSIDVVNDLRARGHHVELTSDVGSFGRGQIILRSPDGTLIGGSEPRADGYAVGF